MVNLKTLVGGIAFVAGEEFVATISGKQRFNALFAGHFRAEIGADGGGIGKRFVVIIGDLRDRFDGIAGIQAELVVLRVEKLGGRASVADFVVARFGKENREGARRIEFFREERGDAAAVRAAAEIGAGGFSAKAFEMAIDSGAHAFADFFGPVSFAAGNLIVIEIPVGFVANVAVVNDQEMAWTEFLDSFVAGE